MCNACGFGCCAFDAFEGCGCDCDTAACRVRCSLCGGSYDEVEDGDCVCQDDDFYDDYDPAPSVSLPMEVEG